MNKLTTKPTTSPRKKITHGITFWLRTGKVNPSIRGYKKIQKYLADLEAQLIDEGGGQANLTAAREILIRSTIRGYGVIMLAELYASRYSVVRPDQAKRGVLAFQPVLEKGYIGILAQIRANLLALGLDKRSPAEPDVLTFVAEFDRNKAEKAALDAKKRPEMPQDERPETETPDITDNSSGFTGRENDDRGGEDNG